MTLGDQQTLWALDIRGTLWFRTGIVAKKPQGEDDHWWQVGARGAEVSQGWDCSPLQPPSFPQEMGEGLKNRPQFY